MRAWLEFDGRLRTAFLSVWLVIATATVVSFTAGPSMLVGLWALVAATAAGLLLRHSGVAIAIALLLALGAVVVVLAEGADALSAVAVAGCVALTGAVTMATRAQHGQASGGNHDRAGTPSAADTRLPPGVADAALLDRLTVHEMTRARRYERPLTLLLVGIEGWPTIYARHGRRTAAEILNALAVKVRRLLRDVDAIGIHGAGRLAVLLPETPLDGALVVAGRIEKLTVDDADVTVRVGAAVFPDDAVTVESLMQQAEAALDLARLEHVDVVERTRLR